MSCNPAIGGLGKGHLVREIDALNGIMGPRTTAPASSSALSICPRARPVARPRAQAGRKLYRQHAGAAGPSRPAWKSAPTRFADFLLDTRRTCIGVLTESGAEIFRRQGRADHRHLLRA